MMSADGAQWDAVVVGAGVAGSYVAAHLAHAGVRTLLVERDQLPRDKVCGCCLNDLAIGVLQSSPVPGVARLLRETGAMPLFGMRLGAAGRTAELRFPAGMVVSRHRLDHALALAACDAGATLIQGTTARWSGICHDQAMVRLVSSVGEYAVRTRLVVAADGLNSTLLASVTNEQPVVATGSLIGAGVVLGSGAAARFAPGLIHMACGKGGYVGLVRLEDGRLDLAMACDAETVRQSGSLGALAGSVLSQAGWTEPEGLRDARWRGTPRLTRSQKTTVAPHFAAVGDASGYIEPFTGEGMGWALAGARAALPVLLARALGRQTGSLANPGRRAQPGRMACRLSASLLRSPGLVGTAVRVLQWMPWCARPVAWMTGRGQGWRMESPGHQARQVEESDGFAG